MGSETPSSTRKGSEREGGSTGGRTRQGGMSLPLHLFALSFTSHRFRRHRKKTSRRPPTPSVRPTRSTRTVKTRRRDRKLLYLLRIRPRFIPHRASPPTAGLPVPEVHRSR